MNRITFIFENVGKVSGILDENLNPKTIEAVLKALPVDSTVSTWGEEIYFTTPVKVKQEKARVDMSIGEIAYWPPGQAICLFFGPTPLSTNNEPKAASPVNVIGRLSDLNVVKKVGNGCEVNVIKEQ